VPQSIVPSVERLVELAARNDDAPVLILGETGTGKGYVARRIHEQSPRAAAAFVEINCASLSPTFVESELFGHERGAFTDAKQAKRGLFEVAGRGTVFLDELGELAPDVQPKLLKAIEEQTFRRLGGTAELRSEARLVCATHQPLAELVEEKRFRADLFYRLQVLTITLPSLRERASEITALAEELLPRGAQLTADARAALVGYRWPGNIRELKNALWRAAILADGAEIAPEVQPKLLKAIEERSIRRLGGTATLTSAARVLVATHVPLAEAVAAGRFRPDLYYRLQACELGVPPLRERSSDVPVLAAHFVSRYSQARPPARISKEALRALERYPWPGNVRELAHAVEFAVHICAGGVVRLNDLPERVRSCASEGEGDCCGALRVGVVALSLEDRWHAETLRLRSERAEAARRKVAECGGNKTRAARALGITRQWLYKLLAEAPAEA
jgi:DNA-binding NtrC family response regulator